MTLQFWAILSAVFFPALAGIALLRRRIPVFRWYCWQCRKIVSSGRFHPGKCPCGTHSLVAYFCKTCASWNTSPHPNWHCGDCSSKDVQLGVEYHLGKAMWRWRTQDA
jgi:hypothetical protein